MAKQLYEKEKIDAIAAKIRKLVPTLYKARFTTEEMPAAVERVYEEGKTEGQTAGYNSGYSTGYIDGLTRGNKNGYDQGYYEGYSVGSLEANRDYDDGHHAGYQKGLAEGIEKVKTEEAKTNEDIVVQVDEVSVTVTTPSGYYAEESKRVISGAELDPITNRVYDEGHYDGYNDGLVEGEEKVKTEEARTSSDVTHSVTKIAATVTIPSGYYAEEVKRVLDVQDGDLDPIVDAAYDEGSEAGYNNGYDTGYNEGYAEGLAQGGGSVDPTTVWELNALPDFESLTSTDILFASNEMEFSRISRMYVAGNLNKQGITYVGASTKTVYTMASGWSNQAYRTITIHEEITDENFLAWLQTNATLISGGSGGGGGSSEDLEALGALCDWSLMTDTSSIPLICLVNYHPTYYMCCTVYTDSGDIPYYYDENGYEVYPEFGEVVVAPNQVLDLTFDYPMSSMGGIYVENVRWTRDGTV